MLVNLQELSREKHGLFSTEYLNALVTGPVYFSSTLADFVKSKDKLDVIKWYNSGSHKKQCKDSAIVIINSCMVKRTKDKKFNQQELNDFVSEFIGGYALRKMLSLNAEEDFITKIKTIHEMMLNAELYEPGISLPVRAVDEVPQQGKIYKLMLRYSPIVDLTTLLCFSEHDIQMKSKKSKSSLMDRIYDLTEKLEPQSVPT